MQLHANKYFRKQHWEVLYAFLVIFQFIFANTVSSFLFNFFLLGITVASTILIHLLEWVIQLFPRSMSTLSKLFYMSNSLDLKYMHAALYRVYKRCGFVLWNNSCRVVSKFFSGRSSHLPTRAILRGNTNWRSDINVVSWYCIGPLLSILPIENWLGFKDVTRFCRAASQYPILEFFYPCSAFSEYGNRTSYLLLNSSGSGMPYITVIFPFSRLWSYSAYEKSLFLQDSTELIFCRIL